MRGVAIRGAGGKVRCGAFVSMKWRGLSVVTFLVPVAETGSCLVSYRGDSEQFCLSSINGQHHQ